MNIGIRPKTVYCPVKEDQIDGGECIIVCDVADNLVKPTVIPDGIEWNDLQCQRCKDCQYHDDIG